MSSAPTTKSYWSRTGAFAPRGLCIRRLKNAPARSPRSAPKATSVDIGNPTGRPIRSRVIYLCSEVGFGGAGRDSDVLGPTPRPLRRAERDRQLRRIRGFARTVIDPVGRVGPDQEAVVRVPIDPVLHDAGDVQLDDAQRGRKREAGPLRARRAGSGETVPRRAGFSPAFRHQ